MSKNLDGNIKSGFTLIELLVVIAIIGILSSVVLSALNTSRGKAANANIKSNLANARAQAELYMDSDGVNGYAAVCTANNSAGGIKSIRYLVDAAYAQSIAVSVGYNLVSGNQSDTSLAACHGRTADWVVSVPLKIAEGTNLYWCVDSTGFSGGRDNPIGVTYVCPAS